jgi:membrane-bound lytic murein transglycosylase B
VIGGLLAGLVIYFIAKGKKGFTATGNMAANGFGEHSPGGYTLGAVILAEVVLTGVFLLVILGSTDDRAPKGFAGLAIGLTLTLITSFRSPSPTRRSTRRDRQGSRSSTVTAPRRNYGCSGWHRSSERPSPEARTRICSADTGNSPTARSAMTHWKPTTTQATTGQHGSHPHAKRQLTEPNTLSRDRIVAALKWRAFSVRAIGRGTPLVLAVIVFSLTGCTHPPTTRVAGPIPTKVAAKGPAKAAPMDDSSATVPAGAQPRLASDPTQLADDLVADEQALRDRSTVDDVLAVAAHRQQAAYRAIARHPEWDAIARPRIPSSLLDTYDRNVDARRQLGAMTQAKDTVPAWRIDPPAPADQLLGCYREAESASGVGWNYLAAINLIESRFGSVNGVSTAGAQGPMQFLPSTFAAYGAGGDINSPRDSIMAAGRYLAANGFANNRDQAIRRYNHSDDYVRAVDEYAAVLAADPDSFAGYYRWDVYYVTTAGDVLLPIGYTAMSPIPVGDYLSTHPQ